MRETLFEDGTLYNVAKKLPFDRLDIQHANWTAGAGSLGRQIFDVFKRTADLEWTARIELDDNSTDYSHE